MIWILEKKIPTIKERIFYMQWKKCKNKIRNIFTSVSSRILLIIIALVLPLNVIAIVYTDRAVSSIEEQARFNIQKIADYNMQELKNRMEVAQTFLTYFLTEDPDCVTMRRSDIDDYTFDISKMKTYSKIRNMAAMSAGGDGYFYYCTDRDDGLIYVNADKQAELQGHLQRILQNYESELYHPGWHIYEWNKKEYLVLLVQDGYNVYGSVIRLANFKRNILSGIEYPISKISITEDDIQKAEANEMYIYSGSRNVYLNIYVDKDEVLEQIANPYLITRGIAVIFLFAIPLLYIVLQKFLIRPLLRVNDAHRQIEEGHGEYRITERSSTAEHSELYRSFNKMADNLHRLKIESYEKELAKQRIELRNLQLQIRPHFLLNTFNLIFSLAQRKEMGMIQETVIYLSEYFRYIFRSDKELELFGKELQMIKGYIRTAAIRYSGRVEAEYEIDPELEFVRMPPLLIHNFVENAVKYGVKQKEVLHILVEGIYDEGTVLFRIEDDGKGMPPEILERNQNMFAGELEPQNVSEHLGLYNSLKRLKYFYGEEAQIMVESRRGEGTCFTISFPYELEVDDESFDCE